MIEQKIAKVQSFLQESNIDGWLLYDFQRRNPLAVDFLQIPSSTHLTRRFFYWIPKEGEPVKLVHKVESHVLESLPGKAVLYLAWQELQMHLQDLLKGEKCVAMEYSPDNAIPSLSYVDAGTVDMIRSMGLQVVSSGFLIQPFVCTLTARQRKLHLEAAAVLEQVAEGAWNYIAEEIQSERPVTEWDVQNWMSSAMQVCDCEWEGSPICAVGSNSSNPHYSPTKHNARLIQKEDFVLIDLWCKKKEEGAVYADITRVGVVAKQASVRQQEIFAIVLEAQKAATQLIYEASKQRKSIAGYEVDLAARSVIERAGYGSYFIHRTGHNIYTQDHGPGAHLDSLETWDDRPLLKETCFSIEPGIYLPCEFGVRLEYDVYITKDYEVEISGGIQEEIKRIL